jgi:hypothetical protein
MTVAVPTKLGLSSQRLPSAEALGYLLPPRCARLGSISNQRLLQTQTVAAAKAFESSDSHTARLKSCPDTNHSCPDTNHSCPNTNHSCPDTNHSCPDTNHSCPDTNHSIRLNRLNKHWKPQSVQNHRRWFDRQPTTDNCFYVAASYLLGRGLISDVSTGSNSKRGSSASAAKYAFVVFNQLASSRSGKSGL